MSLGVCTWANVPVPSNVRISARQHSLATLLRTTHGTQLPCYLSNTSNTKRKGKDLTGAGGGGGPQRGRPQEDHIEFTAGVLRGDQRGDETNDDEDLGAPPAMRLLPPPYHMCGQRPSQAMYYGSETGETDQGCARDGRVGRWTCGEMCTGTGWETQRPRYDCRRYNVS